MPETFESIRPRIKNERVLWVGFPVEKPAVSLARGCNLPELYVSSDHPNQWYLSFEPEFDRAEVINSRLGSLIGPYEFIVLSSGLLSRFSFLIPSLRAALLKLCHHASKVVVEGSWSSIYDQIDENDEERQKLNKTLDEISRMITQSANQRSTYVDRLRARWQGPYPAHSVMPMSGIVQQSNLARGLKSVAVIGGGIAGVTIALACLKRGHRVELIEEDNELLRLGSNQPFLATYPNFSKDGNSLSLLSQYSLGLLAESPYAQLLHQCGRFEPARSKEQAKEQSSLVERLTLGPELLQFLNVRQSQSLWRTFDRAVPESKSLLQESASKGYGGLWIALAAQVAVDRLRQYVVQLAQQSSGLLILRLGHRAKLDQVMNQFDVVVGATGQGTPDFLAQTVPELSLLTRAHWKVYKGSSFSLRTGRLDRDSESLAESDEARIKGLPIFGGAVSLQAMGGQQWLLGSGYSEEGLAGPSDEQQWQILINGARQLAGTELHSFIKLQAHHGARCVVRDRMPLIGPLFRAPVRSSNSSTIGTDCGSNKREHQAQIYLASGFGSRGLLWAHLAAKLINDHIDGISPSIGLKALKSIDPLRYSERPKSSFED